MIKITKLPAIPAGTISSQTTIPVSKTSTDPKTYKMTLDQAVSWIIANGGGGGSSGYSGFSGVTGAPGASGRDGYSITKGLVLVFDPTRIFYYRSNNTTSYGVTSTNITAVTQNISATSVNPVVFTISRYTSSGSLINTTSTSGTGAGYNKITYTNTQFGSAFSAVVSATWLSGSDIYVDTDQIIRAVDAADGTPALVGVLTNYSVALPAGSDGTVTDYTDAVGSFNVYSGSTLIPTGSITYSYVEDGLTGTINGLGIYQVTSIPSGTTSARLLLYATYGSTTLSAAFTVTKSKQGTAGTAKSVQLTLSKNIFHFVNGAPATLNDATTATALLDNITPATSSTTINWTATLYTSAGSAITATLTTVPSNSAQRVLPASQFTSNPAAVECVITASITDISTVVYSDTQTVVRVEDGSTNTLGYLTNSIASINADSNGVVSASLSALSGDFVVYYGGTDITTQCVFGVYDIINGGGSSIVWREGTYGPGTLNRYQVSAIGATLNPKFILTAIQVSTGRVITQTFDVAKVVAGPQGDAGAGPVYQGEYNASRTYFFIAGARTDIVLYGGSYYRAINAAKSGSAGWGQPDITPADWSTFGATFESVATGLLLTQDAVIGRYLNMGGYTGTTLPNTAIRSYSTTPTISATRAGARGTLAFTGNGFFLGYPSGTVDVNNGGADAVFYVGNGFTGSSNYMFWDGDALKIQGNIQINAFAGNGIYSGKSSYTDTTAGWWLGIDALDSNKPKFNIGNSSTYIKWTGTTLQVQGDLYVTGGAAVASQTYANSTSSTVFGIFDPKVFTDSTGLVSKAPSPGSNGLYLGSTHLGYYSGGSWKSYMSDTGNFYLSGGSGSAFQWISSTETLRVGNNTNYMQWSTGAGTLVIEGVQSSSGLIITSSIGLRSSVDSGSFTITGGTGNGTQYGAQIDLVGINYPSASQGGQLVLQAGEGTQSTIAFHTNRAGTVGGANIGVQRLIIGNDGLTTVKRASTYLGYNTNAGNLRVDGNIGIGTDPQSCGTGSPGDVGSLTMLGTLTVNGNIYGTNALGERTVSTDAPTGGSDGDIWLVVSA